MAEQPDNSIHLDELEKSAVETDEQSLQFLRYTWTRGFLQLGANIFVLRSEKHSAD